MGARGAVATVLVLGVLVGGAVVADGVVRDRTEDRVATELRDGVAGLDVLPSVEIHGFPFLTQVLVGRMQHVEGEAGELTVDGLTIEDLTVDLRGLTLDEPMTAEEVHLTGRVPLESVQGRVDAPIELATSDGALVAAAEVFGLPLEVGLVPRAAGRAIEVEVVSLSLAGATVAATDLPGALTAELDAIRLPLDELPEGVELTGVRVETDAFHLELSGTDVLLDADALGER